MFMELIVQLIAGLFGGNAVGAAAKNLSLGTVGNSVAGLIGGLGGGQLLNLLMSGNAAAAVTDAAAAGGVDIAALLADIASGAVGGAVLVAVVALVKNRMAK